MQHIDIHACTSASCLTSPQAVGSYMGKAVLMALEGLLQKENHISHC